MTDSKASNDGGKIRVLSCGIVPVRLDAGGIHVLLLRAYSYWDFPKGVTHDGEAPLDAAIRELEEETALSEVRFRWGKEFLETPPYGRGKVARYYVAEVPEGTVAIRPNPITHAIEHHEHRWVSAEDARRLLVPRVAKVLDWAMARIKSNASLESASLARFEP